MLVFAVNLAFGSGLVILGKLVGQEMWIPFMVAAFAFSLIAITWTRMPAIKSWLDPVAKAEKRHRNQIMKDQTKEKENKRERFRPEIKGIRRNPLLVKPILDSESGVVEVTVASPQTLRWRVVRILVWLANRPWWVSWSVTDILLSWVAKRLVPQVSFVDRYV